MFHVKFTKTYMAVACFKTAQWHCEKHLVNALQCISQ